MNDSANLPATKRRHVWPWILVVLLVVGVLLAVVAIRREVERIKEQRQPQMPNPA
jgi:F0F1-type ATP synthase assembly protein I